MYAGFLPILLKQVRLGQLFPFSCLRNFSFSCPPAGGLLTTILRLSNLFLTAPLQVPYAIGQFYTNERVHELVNASLSEEAKATQSVRCSPFLLSPRTGC
jgi:hypothetical protein